ncbi:DUF397 domain-containing protein [Nonomuraea sp. NPDC049758]|uniref:DUF397 domain-containing protein n=1 Tax=Nonomuraea sp. NPDC049758 TaxID=3154360 RepID=UPI003414B392
MINADVIDKGRAEWRKSSFSGGGNDCVEVATNLPGVVGVRDSEDPLGPVHWFTLSQWRAFTAGVRDGQFDV